MNLDHLLVVYKEGYYKDPKIGIIHNPSEELSAYFYSTEERDYDFRLIHNVFRRKITEELIPIGCGILGLRGQNDNIRIINVVPYSFSNCISQGFIFTDTMEPTKLDSITPEMKVRVMIDLHDYLIGRKISVLYKGLRFNNQLYLDIFNLLNINGDEPGLKELYVLLLLNKV